MSRTRSLGGGSFRGAAVRVLQRVHRWTLGGSVSPALSLIQSVRDWSWILHRDTTNKHRESYMETFKVLHPHPHITSKTVRPTSSKLIRKELPKLSLNDFAVIKTARLPKATHIRWLIMAYYTVYSVGLLHYITFF